MWIPSHHTFTQPSLLLGLSVRLGGCLLELDGILRLLVLVAKHTPASDSAGIRAAHGQHVAHEQQAVSPAIATPGSSVWPTVQAGAPPALSRRAKHKPLKPLCGPVQTLPTTRHQGDSFPQHRASTAAHTTDMRHDMKAHSRSRATRSTGPKCTKRSQNNHEKARGVGGQGLPDQ